MGFVGKIAKATENPAIKYKSLYFSDLYLIFRRFSILFVDLIAVHEVLPLNIGQHILRVRVERDKISGNYGLCRENRKNNRKSCNKI